MHGQNAFAREKVIHEGEDGFLHLTGILSSKQNNFPAFQTQVNAGARRHAGCVPVRRETARVVDHKVRLTKRFQFEISRTDQHVVHEQSMIRSSTDDADFDPCVRIPASVSVDAINS